MNADDNGLQKNDEPVPVAVETHPLGMGIGAAGGLAAGAAAGSIVGPVGTVIGAAIGALAGGFAGKSVAEMIDPNAEDAFWRENYATRPYVNADYGYDDYGPAYRYGVDAFGRHEGRPFEEVESKLETEWTHAKGTSRLEWDHAKSATRDAWERVRFDIDHG